MSGSTARATRPWASAGLVALLLCGCKSSDEREPLPRVVTANDFLTSARPTFVVGTLGDDRVDRAILGQVELVRQLFFADSPLVTDGDALADMPAHAVVYGGPNVNALMRELAPALPFVLTADGLAIGGQELDGTDLQLVTVLPARKAQPGAHPELLLYAGTGPIGVAEINAASFGNEAIMVADAFGPLFTGHWVRAKDGALTAKLGPASPRIAWRDVTREHATYRFPADLAAAEQEAELVAAAEQGIKLTIEMLEIAAPLPLTIYVYPDVRSKQALTGKAGDAHAVVGARVLHIIGRAAVRGVASLVAHEATHVLAYDAFGPASTALMGEGLAVWVAGGYGGGGLDAWAARIDERHSVRELLGPTFRTTSERVAYPLAGLLVQTAVELVGREQVTRHLLGATAATWDDACKRAGTSAELIEAALAQKLAKPAEPGRQ